MKIRFQADEDLNENIVTGVRRHAPEIDFQTAHDAGIKGLDDADVLAYAANVGRILVTHDRQTMPAHFANFIEKNQSPGVFVISQKTDLMTAIEELILMGLASEAKEYANTILTIPL